MHAGLLQAIEGLGEAIDVMRLGGVDESSGIKTVHLFVQRAVQERVRHIKLVNRPVARRGEGQHGADGGGLDDRREGLAIVDVVALPEAAHDPACLVTLKGSVGLVLVLEHPFAGDEVVVGGGARHQLQGAVADEGVDLVAHGGELVGVANSDTH